MVNLKDKLLNCFKGKSKTVDFYTLYRYSTIKERFFIALSIFASICSGCIFPINFIILGDTITSFSQKTISPAISDKVYGTVKWFVILGVIVWLFSFLENFFINIVAYRVTKRIRFRYFRAILDQNIAWYDSESTGQLITELSESINKIDRGIGDKVTLALNNSIGFISGVIIGFSRSWRLSLLGLATVPFVAASLAITEKVFQIVFRRQIKAYSKAGSVSSEVISSIKTVTAFGGQSKELERYTKNLDAAAKAEKKKAVAINFSIGLIGLSIFSSISLLFVYGLRLLTSGEILAGDVQIVIFSFVIGSLRLGNAIPTIQYFFEAKSAGFRIYDIINRKPPVNKNLNGVKPDVLKGDIEFKDVTFSYPTRKNVTIMKELSLKIEKNTTVAFVGKSGSGKSTCIQLLQRFYDPDSGEITVDGVDLKDYNLKWLRSKIGVVSQEPILFAGTIAENIRMGNFEATTEEIENAAKKAFAHDFIMKQPMGYDTWIAEGGGGMSGGQKQRIAIARALVRNPSILLLDEATSALDSKSEKIVQKALDQAMRNRTVILVAHRLTTVRNADKIIVMENGCIKESGSHEELVQNVNGAYLKMLNQHGAINEPAKKEEGDEEKSDTLFEDEVTKLVRNYSSRLSKRSQKSAIDEIDSMESVDKEDLLIIQNESKFQLFKKVVIYNRDEYPFLIGVVILSLLKGVVLPCMSVVQSEIFLVYQLVYVDKAKALKHVDLISGMLFFLAILRFIFILIGGVFAGYNTANLSKRLRRNMFNQILKQEIGWFDRTENQTGILTTRLAFEAGNVANMTAVTIGSLVQTFSLVVCIIVIIFYYSWQLALLALVFIPIMAVVGIFQVKAIRSNEGIGDLLGVQIAQESISNPRTVTAFSLESYFYEKFVKENKAKSIYKNEFLSSLLFGFTQCIQYILYAGLLALGAYLVDHNELTVPAMFKVFIVVNFTSQELGRITIFIPQLIAGLASTKMTFDILERESKIPLDKGICPTEKFDGKVYFKNVQFNYPTRKNVKVLQGLTHTIDARKSVGLVSQSGGGKSTALQLVQRFYDPDNVTPSTNPKKYSTKVIENTLDAGIYMNGYNLVDLNPQWIRRQLGVVSQEPNLFDVSIRENIAYGLNHVENVSMEEVIKAAKMANIHDFIQSLPENYDTRVGEKGSKLSGGQKQRIAIARALIRDPPLLLLDEATSALDNESEKVVQKAIDTLLAAGGRTSLIVAHRLTTIQNADEIVVLENGKRAEYGSPAQLMAMKGLFYDLNTVIDE